MRLGLTLALLVAVVTGCASVHKHGTGLPPTPTGLYAQTFEKTDGDAALKLNYLLYIPEEYPASKEKWPLVLFLHGAGERGDDLEKVKMHGPPKLIEREQKTFPFLLVSPQCPTGESWSNDKMVATLSALLDDVAALYRVDRNRIYLTGLSMGGFGTWRLACDYPDRFAAIAPICGRGNPEKVEAIRHLPIWVFHGQQDKTVPLKNSQDMVDALKALGSDVKFTVYPGAGHDSWTETYNNPELYEWMLKQKRAGRK